MPVPAHSPFRQAESLTDLFFGETTKVAHLDNFDQALIDLREFIQGFRNAEDLLFAGSNPFDGGIERDSRVVATAPGGVALPHLVDYDRAHHLRRIGHKPGALGDIDLAGLENAEKRLVDKRSSVEQRERFVASQAGMRQPAEVLVEQREDLLGSHY